jgi:3-oxoacyl-[acyl-carrier protein] reductase
MLQDLAGKRVLVTGASTGIGAAAAKALSEARATIALHFNQSRSEAEAVAAAIRAKGGTCHLVQGDLTKGGESKRVVEEAVKALGGLDILINNAGSLIKRTPFEELSDEFIDKVFDLNVRSVIAGCQAAVPHLEKSGGGSIINVGSIAGAASGGPGAAIYGASKGFIHNLTRHLAGLRRRIFASTRWRRASSRRLSTPRHHRSGWKSCGSRSRWAVSARPRIVPAHFSSSPRTR